MRTGSVLPVWQEEEEEEEGLLTSNEWMSVGRHNTLSRTLPLGARAQHRQRAPYPHSPLGPVVRCTADTGGGGGEGLFKLMQ